jgi:hypothetical protein
VSDGLDEFQRRLELITSGRCPADAPLDAESAALREAWLALGDLLEASQGSGGQRPTRVSPRPRGRRRKGLWVAVAAALAGSLLMAVSIGQHLRPAGPPAASSPASPLSGELSRQDSKPSPAPPNAAGAVHGVPSTQLVVGVRGAAANSTLNVSIGGVIVGTLTTDANGNGNLVLSSNPKNPGEQPFPSNFPSTIAPGTAVSVGTLRGSLVAQTNPASPSRPPAS